FVNKVIVIEHQEEQARYHHSKHDQRTRISDRHQLDQKQDGKQIDEDQPDDIVDLKIPDLGRGERLLQDIGSYQVAGVDPHYAEIKRRKRNARQFSIIGEYRTYQ